MNRANEAAPRPSSTNVHTLGGLSSTGEDTLPRRNKDPFVSSQTADEPSPPPQSLDRVSIGEKQARYVGDSHWTAILENVCLCLIGFYVPANMDRLLV